MMSPEIREQLALEDSPLNTRLLQYCKNRIRAAEQRMTPRHATWREGEKLLRAFRTADASDREVRSNSLTEGVQKIVVPYTYAQIQSMLAFLVTVFTERKPIIPVEPVGDFTKAAILHEHLIEHQMDAMRPKGLLVMIQWFFDALRYDLGLIKNVWTIREWPDLVRSFGTDAFGEPIDEVHEEDVVAYEGNEALNVSPFDFYPDPNRPVGEFQKGEFVAHRMRRSPTELAVKQAEGLYVGTEFIKNARGGRGEVGRTGTASGSANAQTVGMSSDTFRGTIDADDDGYTTIHEMWAFVKPRELGLPTTRTSNLPTLWVFTVANLNRVIRAEPANLPGRRFPFAAIQINYDIHSPATPSVIEMTSGLQYHISWLFNSRMANVRKTLNNDRIIDPSMIEAKDWSEPNVTGIWRINKDYYGTPGATAAAVNALPVQDVTGGHLSDARIAQDIMEAVTGASKLVQGLSNTGRRSATETQAQISLASGRMKLITTIASAQGVSEWAEMMVANTQMFFGERLTLPVNEAYQQILQGQMATITPELLQGVFRIPLLEQGIPTDKAFHANVLREMFTTWMQAMQSPNPGMAQNINGLEIFAQLMRLLGIRNLKDFFITQQPGGMQVMPEEQVQQQVDQGNLVPDVGPSVSSDGFGMFDAVAPNTGSNGASSYGM